MIVERSMDPGWLSNAYLVADHVGGHGVLIDAGGPPGPLLETVDRHRLAITHILVTHHHHDHVAHLADLRRRFDVPVLAHRDEASQLDGPCGELADGDVVESGELRIEAVHTPGHTGGMLAFVVNGEECFTGDTLFAGSVGGVHAPGSTG